MQYHVKCLNSEQFAILGIGFDELLGIFYFIVSSVKNSDYHLPEHLYMSNDLAVCIAKQDLQGIGILVLVRLLDCTLTYSIPLVSFSPSSDRGHGTKIFQLKKLNALKS